MRKDQVAAAAKALDEYDKWSAVHGGLERLVRALRIEGEGPPPPGYLFLPGDLAGGTADIKTVIRGVPIPAEDCLDLVKKRLDEARHALSVEFDIYVDR